MLAGAWVHHTFGSEFERFPFLGDAVEFWLGGGSHFSVDKPPPNDISIEGLASDHVKVGNANTIGFAHTKWQMTFQLRTNAAKRGQGLRRGSEMTKVEWKASLNSLADVIVLSLPRSALVSMPDPDYRGAYAVQIGGELSHLFVIKLPPDSGDGEDAAIELGDCLYSMKRGDFALVCKGPNVVRTIVVTGYYDAPAMPNHRVYYVGLPTR